ncbi:14-alpha sterol demethylase Cyp51A [Leptodontidium sp. 2 PMI_412]|nr:14-alpha sterol demethylase Cyp51A [Leptodontidium sp. 2 PMI_412]
MLSCTMHDLIRTAVYAGAALFASIAFNVIRQLFFRNPNEPPVVFHWVPLLGSAVTYGMEPYAFFSACQKKHGDIFTFVLLGKKITVYLGLEGNEFILNGKLRDVNAEEIYGQLTTPVFGADVVYDCPNSKFMEQKKFVKYGLTQKALESHVELIEEEVLGYIKTSSRFKGSVGTIDIPSAMSEITIFTAGRALQGQEVRQKLTAEFADLYHDLDKGFAPINFLLPWAPLPHNRKRDAARERMKQIYVDIINNRRKNGADESSDMIWNLMRCTYKDGHPVPDKEIAHLMICLLMAGQHTSSSTSSWIMLRLASEPKIAAELYQEQLQNFGVGDRFTPLQYNDLAKLPVLQNVIKETLRLHGSIHSIMRKVKTPLPVPGTAYVIPVNHVLLASPGVTAMSSQFFPDPLVWNPHRWNDHVEEADDGTTVDYGYGAVSKGTRSPYLPFGAGRHRCIGEKFAYLNLAVIVSTLVRNFKFENLAERTGVPSTDYTSLFSGPQSGSFVCWERRVREDS